MKLIYSRVEPIINQLLPRKQAGIWRGRLTVDQVTFLTQEIENNYSAKKKAGALSTSQQLTVQYGIAASPASFCVFCRTGTRSR